MGWNDTWLPSARSALISLRGDGATWAEDGQSLPALTALDTIAMIGQLAPGLGNCIVRANGQGDASHAAVADDCVDDDGRVLTGDAMSKPGSYVDARKYLGFYPSDQPWRRSEIANDGLAFSTVYVPFYVPLGEENQLLGFVKQAVDDWQRLCDASAAAIQLNAADATQAMGVDEVSEFWAAMAALCVDLDVLAENPPVTVTDKLKGALRDAVDTTEKFVGKAIADISNEVGKTAANVATGFFGEAGLLSVAVAGIALFLFLK